MKILKQLFFCIIFSCHLALCQENFWQKTNGPTGGNIHTIKQNLNGHIFIGTGDRFNGGGSIFRSVDNGDSWTQLTFDLPSVCFNDLVINSEGHIFTGTFGRGVFRSVDNGQSWEEKNNGLAYEGVFSLAIDSMGVLFVGTNGGLFQSSDNGENWIQIGFFNQVTALTIDQAGNLFAGTYGSGIKLFRNNGRYWNDINGGLFNMYIKVLVLDVSGNVYAGTGRGGLYRFVNNENVWKQINECTTNHDVLSFGCSSKGYLYFGTGGDGVYFTNDYGETWLHIGLTQVQSLFINSADYIFAGNGTNGLFRSHTDSINWLQKNSGLINTYVSGITVNSEGLIFAGTEHNGVFRSSDNGQDWVMINNGLEFSSINTLTIDIQDCLFAGTEGGVYRSCNNGELWEKKFSTGWSVNTIATVPSGYVFASIEGDLINYMVKSSDNGETWELVLRRSFNSFACNSKGYIFAVSYGIMLFSEDSGDNWRSPDSILTNVYLQAIVIDSNDWIITVTDKGEIFRSSDNGATWEKTASNLPKSFYYTIICNPEGQIFAGTDVGVFYSSDKGDSWVELDGGLPNTRVLSIAFNSEGFLFIGTMGHGVFKSTSKVTSVDRTTFHRAKCYSLIHNYPNPFNEFTTFKFVVPQPAFVRLKLFDLLGREVAELVTQKYNAGNYTISWDARGFPSGVYCYRYQINEHLETGKLILLK